MTKTDLLEIISNNENSGVEFKRDDVRPEDLAKECVAISNLKGVLFYWALKMIKRFQV